MKNDKVKCWVCNGREEIIKEELNEIYYNEYHTTLSNNIKHKNYISNLLSDLKKD